jgi:hypothetical protein
MLARPPRKRSARGAALSDRNKLRRNFFRPVAIETNFAFGPAALRHATRELNWLIKLRRCPKAREAMIAFQRSVAKKATKKTKSPLDTAGFRQTLPILENLERAKGFEPSTPTLARSCSTTELHPHPRGWRRSLAGNGRAMPNAAPECNSPRMGRNRPDDRYNRRSLAKSGKKPADGVPAIANWAFKRQLGLEKC